MLKKHIHILLMTSTFILAIPSFSSAQKTTQPWDLPGIDIITRAERGANEELRIRVDDGDDHTFVKDEKTKQAETYLLKNYPDDFVIENIINKNDEDYLTRSLQYNPNKKAIVIHHTVSNTEEVEEEGVNKHLQDMYMFHTITRGRGDIGYNFLLDRSGNIYEGRYGGESVIGAHTRRNNTNTIGISLIGNYDIEDPTTEQWKSLVMLIVQLSLKYDIDPFDAITYHQASNIEPYIQHNHHDGIIGHKDASVTSCPGENIYKLLPQLKKDVNKMLLMRKNDFRITQIENINQVINTNTKANQTTITLPYDGDAVAYCDFVEDTQLEVVSCREKGNNISITLKRKTIPTYGQHMLRIHDANGYDTIYYVTLQREKDITELTSQRIKKHKADQNTFSALTDKSPYPKITETISLSKAQNLLQKEVTVLLDELSNKYLSWDITCDHCKGIITVDGEEAETINRGTSTLHIELFDDDTLSITTQDDGRFASSLEIEATNNQVITIPSYSRASYAGIPRNSFYSKITIGKNGGAENNKFIVTNTLPLKAYIMGIVETNDQEHTEKNKVMAILSKQYMVHYLADNNRHPNIPEGAIYQAIDDPDQFQKYIGAGTEKTLNKRPKAVLATWDDFIVYNNQLAFTPYFSCSPGITRDALLTWGRNDTPYLKPVLDRTNSACDDFFGHGIGLSGKGAQYMASRGIPYKHILEYYYPGTSVQ